MEIFFRDLIREKDPPNSEFPTEGGQAARTGDFGSFSRQVLWWILLQSKTNPALRALPGQGILILQRSDRQQKVASHLFVV